MGLSDQLFEVACPDCGAMLKIDPVTRAIIAHTPIPLPRRRSAGHDRTLLQDMAVGEGALWVLGDATDPRVWKVDRVDGRILVTTRLPFAPRSIAVGAGGVWVTGGIADAVAGLVTLLVALKTRNLPLAMVVGVASVVALRAVF